MTKFRAACVQMTSTPSADHDIAQDLALMQRAADDGATLIALPEFCAGLDVKNGALAPVAFPEDTHPALAAFCGFARARRVEILVGSVSIADGSKIFNRSFHIDWVGEIAARYDKIHMFDIDLGNDGRYCESDVMEPGKAAVMTETHGLRAGMSICYDLRFPHLYRHYAKSGAEILFVPAAFTQKTGEAHWHALLRARAIENGAFVIAPGQCGTIAGGGGMYGHSLVVDPWGHVVCDGGTEPGVTIAEIDSELVSQTRQKIPSLANERDFERAPS